MAVISTTSAWDKAAGEKIPVDLGLARRPFEYRSAAALLADIIRHLIGTYGFAGLSERTPTVTSSTSLRTRRRRHAAGDTDCSLTRRSNPTSTTGSERSIRTETTRRSPPTMSGHGRERMDRKGAGHRRVAAIGQARSHGCRIPQDLSAGLLTLWPVRRNRQRRTRNRCAMALFGGRRSRLAGLVLPSVGAERVALSRTLRTSSRRVARCAAACT